MEGHAVQTLFSPLVLFRNSPLGLDAWDSAGKPAGYTGRFHRRGEPLPLYGSTSKLAALGELELHTQTPLEPAREVLRRVTAMALATGARVLAADHVETLESTGLTLDRVYHPTDYAACHVLADYARSLGGVIAISTQSNAKRGHRTLAVLPEHLSMTGLVDYWEGSLNLLRLAFEEE